MREDQFEAFFRHQFPRLVRYAARRVRADLAEDLALHALEKVWSKNLADPHSDEEREHVENLVFVILRGLISNELRAERRRARLLRKAHHHAVEPELTNANQLPTWALELPDADQEMLGWLALGFTVAEISGIVGCSPVAARKRLSRIRARVAQQVPSSKFGGTDG